MSDNNNSTQTPLEQVQAEQARQRENLEVTQQRPDPTPEVVSQGNPSDRRKFPQRQMYEGGNDSSETIPNR